MTQQYRTTLVTAATANPVTQQQAKDQLRITTSDEDDKLDLFIAAATAHTETVLGRALVAQTWDLFMDYFPPGGYAIEMPKAPLISVTSIKYTDDSDVQQTWDSANYTVDTDQDYHSRIYPAISGSYPSTRIYPKAVEIRFIAGYENSGASPVDLADNVPTSIKQAILLLIGHMWENREASTIGVKVESVPMGYDALLANYKVRAF